VKTVASHVNIMIGDPAPTFKQRALTNPLYSFDTAAGRYIVLCFYGTMANPHSAQVMAAVSNWTDIFDDDFASFFGVSVDPTDLSNKRIQERYPGYRHFLDFDRAVCRLYGAACIEDDGRSPRVALNRRWVILSPALRVLHVVPFAPDQSDIAEVKAFLKASPQPDFSTGIALQAPILFLPNVLEPALCARLIETYHRLGGEESGYMTEVDGVTKLVIDHYHKRRQDILIDDQDLISTLQARFKRRIVPEISKAYQYHVTRMERYIVACYSAKTEGHFRPHRDNTTKGTAHRRFAVSINLNADFSGGEIYFPEFSHQSFKPPIGGAVVVLFLAARRHPGNERRPLRFPAVLI